MSVVAGRQRTTKPRAFQHTELVPCLTGLACSSEPCRRFWPDDRLTASPVCHYFTEACKLPADTPLTAMDWGLNLSAPDGIHLPHSKWLARHRL